ncbi:MAG: glycosyltransferase family 4 protein [Chloroflexi bacterium]|nr:glycosyltransferase family 4 protein [Chloroflexota bacterium]
MRVVMLSKACIVGTYQRKLEELAKCPDLDLTVLTPPAWRDSRGEQILERVFTRGYELRVTPMALNGRFHLHFYPRLAQELARIRPDLLHIDEEPYNFATRHAMSLARRMNIPACFFTWQNLQRTYPPPFAMWERYNYRHAAYAIAGNHDAERVLRAKGYRGPIRVIPQFGVDPHLFAPGPGLRADRPFTIGYAGGLLYEKGVDILLRACAQLHGEWRLQLAGAGAYRSTLEKLADELGIAARIHWPGKISSVNMPAFYHGLDVLVLPSRTRPNWMEQFGRVLIEAMASGVPVIGSRSGEIPYVIAEAGLLFEEEDAAELAAHLQALMNDEAARLELTQRGRRRVLAHYTQARIAAETYEVYQEMLMTHD